HSLATGGEKCTILSYIRRRPECLPAWPPSNPFHSCLQSAPKEIGAAGCPALRAALACPRGETSAAARRVSSPARQPKPASLLLLLNNLQPKKTSPSVPCSLSPVPCCHKIQHAAQIRLQLPTVN